MQIIIENSGKLTVTDRECKKLADKQHIEQCNDHWHTTDEFDYAAEEEGVDPLDKLRNMVEGGLQ